MLSIKSNQYDFPCKTYYYIVNGEGKIYHYSDGKFRKKCLKQARTYWYYSEQEAQCAIDSGKIIDLHITGQEAKAKYKGFAFNGWKWYGFLDGKFHNFQKKIGSGWGHIKLLHEDMLNGNVEYMLTHELTR